MPFSGGQRHKSFEQSSAGTARSFAEALVPIGEHVAHLIPQIAKIVDPADDLIELIFRQRADFAAGSTARITNFENSREFFKREADFERTPDQPDALDRFRRILPVARCRSVGTRQDPDALIVTERIGAHAAFTSQFAGSHVTFPCLSVHLCAQYGPWNRFGGQALFFRHRRNQERPTARDTAPEYQPHRLGEQICELVARIKALMNFTPQACCWIFYRWVIFQPVKLPRLFQSRVLRFLNTCSCCVGRASSP